MVIGYSFSDAHINKAIGDGIDKGLKLFIIDPCGVDVLDKGLIRDEYMEKLAPNIIGASRRPLRSIFNDDVVSMDEVFWPIKAVPNARPTTSAKGPASGKTSEL